MTAPFNKSPRRYSSAVAVAADRWAVTLRDAERHNTSIESERESFLSWMAESPEHLRAFFDSYGSLQLLEEQLPAMQAPLRARSADVISLFPNLKPAEATPSRRFSNPRAFFLAASLAVMGVAALFIWNRAAPVCARTAVGQQRTCTLSDGSIVFLNTDSQIDVRYSSLERRIDLLRGEALFVVEHDPQRPFTVNSGDAAIRAVGTQFNVRLRADATDVSVVEGVVQVAALNAGAASATPEHNSARVVTGEQAEIVNGKVTSPEHPNVGAALSWRARRLVFTDSTYAEVVSEFARYSNKRIHVEGALAHERHITGIFDSNRPEAFILYAQHDPSLSVTRSGDDWVIRKR